MDVKLSRDWATPWAMGAFVITGVTGVLMFFHLDQGLNKPAHEWLGWLLVAGVGVHAAANWIGFKRHLAGRTGRLLVGLAVVITALSFWQPPGAPKGGSPGKLAAEALMRAPLDAVAPLVALEPAALRQRLSGQGLKVPAGAATITEIARQNGKEPAQVLSLVLKP